MSFMFITVNLNLNSLLVTRQMILFYKGRICEESLLFPDDRSRLSSQILINMNGTPVPIGQIHSFHSYV